MKTSVLLTLSTLVLAISAFGGSEDKFLKKYAMMKIYESCFGPEVVKKIRQEMRAACLKCSALEPLPVVVAPEQPLPPKNEQELFPAQPNFDPEKLHQTILAYRPNAPPQPQAQQFYRPYTPSGGMAPFYSLPFVNPYANPMMYPGFSQQPPYGAYPLLGQSFYGNRVSRDMDIKAQLELLTSKMSSKVKNVTCVMQELGYLDEKLEPNFSKITERISNLPVGEELKRDMQDGVTYCQQFSQCVPDVKRHKSPLSKELIRPIFFFKCYKHKKLEACIMKDVREKYAGVTDEEFEGDVELSRTGKSANLPKSEEQINELASSMYEFLYGSESDVNIDSIL